MLVSDVALVLDELLEHRELIGLLKATEALAHGAGLRSDHDDRAMGPEGGCNGRHAVGDTRAVLAYDHTVTTADPGIAVGHVGCTLLVDNGNQANARRGEDVHGIHERRAHDAEDGGDAVRHHRLDEGLAGSHAGHQCTPVPDVDSIGHAPLGTSPERYEVRAYN